MQDRVLKRVGRALLFACAFVGATSAFAGLGKVAGTVKDAQTGAPLPGVDVLHRERARTPTATISF